MAPKGKKKKYGMMRDDAARDAMRKYGFGEPVINESIKELLEVYGEDGWFLIEDDRYDVLLHICLENQQIKNNNFDVGKEAEGDHVDVGSDHCGLDNVLLSNDKEERDHPDEETEGDDDEMVMLTPEPLCEELEELLREVREEKKRKRVSVFNNYDEDQIKSRIEEPRRSKRVKKPNPKFL